GARLLEPGRLQRDGGHPPEAPEEGAADRRGAARPALRPEARREQDEGDEDDRDDAPPRRPPLRRQPEGALARRKRESRGRVASLSMASARSLPPLPSPPRPAGRDSPTFTESAAGGSAAPIMRRMPVTVPYHESSKAFRVEL